MSYQTECVSRKLDLNTHKWTLHKNTQQKYNRGLEYSVLRDEEIAEKEVVNMTQVRPK